MAETNGATVQTEDERIRQYAETFMPQVEEEDEDEEGSPAVVTPAPQDDFSSDLIDRAREYGLSEEDAREFGSPKALRSALSMADRTAAASSRQHAPQPQAQAQPPEVKKRERKALAKEQFDESLMGVIEELRTELDELHAQNGEVRGAVGYALNKVAAREQLDYSDRMDGYFKGLDEEAYGDSLGKGNGLDVIESHGANSKQLRTRIEVATTMAALQEGYERLGQRSPSERELFKRALNAVVGERAASKVSAAARKELQKTLAAGKDKVTARPTSKPDSTKATPEQRRQTAVRNMAALIKRGGINVGDE